MKLSDKTNLRPVFPPIRDLLLEVVPPLFRNPQRLRSSKKLLLSFLSRRISSVLKFEEPRFLGVRVSLQSEMNLKILAHFDKFIT